MFLPGPEPREDALQLLHRLLLFADAGLEEVPAEGEQEEMRTRVTRLKR